MSTDRELLELAAKAGGYEIIGWEMSCGVEVAILADLSRWQPLLKNEATDCMGDALRLAVMLKLSVKHGIDIFDDTNSMSAYAYYRDVGECQFEPHGSDPCAAACRAIVRAAAEIGRAMP